MYFGTGRAESHRCLHDAPGHRRKKPPPRAPLAPQSPRKDPRHFVRRKGRTFCTTFGFVVDHDGGVFFSDSLFEPRYSLGNFRRDSFSVFDGERLERLRMRYDADLPACTACPIARFCCQKGDYAELYERDPDLASEFPNCDDFARRVLRVLATARQGACPVESNAPETSGHSMFDVPDFPELITIKTTNICNLRCSHCPHTVLVSEGDRPRGLMPFDIFRQLVDEVGRASPAPTLRQRRRAAVAPRVRGADGGASRHPRSRAIRSIPTAIC